MKNFRLLLSFQIVPLLLLINYLNAEKQSTRFKIKAEVIGGISGQAASTRFENFGVNEPITGLSIKDLPNIKNFAGFVGGIVPLDQDMDGLSDIEEVALGTDKTKADTDGDGLTDKEEVELGTDPLNTDTDGDGYSDLAEVNASTNPGDPLSNPNRNPTFISTPELSIRENKPMISKVGTLGATDPDGDMLTFSLQPISGSKDNKFFTLSSDGNLKTTRSFDYESKNKYILKVRVSDGRGGLAELQFEVLVSNDILDDTEVLGMMDDDKDGLSNDAEEDIGTNPNKADSDGDGLNDREEYIFGSDPLMTDTDGDELNDWKEYILGSNPLLPDTDGDGYSDLEEYEAGTSPEDRFDYPGFENPRKNPKAQTDSPDGKLYQIHHPIDGLSWADAQILADKLGGKVAEVSGDDSELIQYLLMKMETEEIETENDDGEVAAWIRNQEDFESIYALDLGNSELVEGYESDFLAVILVFEIPKVMAPIVRTLPIVKLSESRWRAESEILDNGGEDPFRYGFELTQSLRKDENEKPRILSGEMENGKFFSEVDRLTPGVTYYIRGFAENSSGLTKGNFKRIKVEANYKIPFGGRESGEGKWMVSDWFGSFHRANDNWIYHAGFAWWIYVANEEGFGQWFWTEELGWCWTGKEIFPFIWIHKKSDWLFWMRKSKNEKEWFWDYALQSPVLK